MDVRQKNLKPSESLPLAVQSVHDLNKLQFRVNYVKVNPIKKTACRRANTENVAAFKS